jgi:hypothetical protein
LSLKEIEFDNEQVAEFYRLIGQNVKRLRKEKNVSQLELGLAIGHTGVGTISVAEVYYNSKHFNLEHLYKIAAVLECDVCEFFRPIDGA